MGHGKKRSSFPRPTAKNPVSMMRHEGVNGKRRLSAAHKAKISKSLTGRKKKR